MHTSFLSSARKALGCLSALVLALAGSLPANAQTIDKEQAHARMIDLVAQRDQARALADLSAVQAAEQELRQISDSLGGDLPVAQGSAEAGVLGGPGVIPQPPLGMTVTTTSVTQNTPVAIPTGPGVVTSTLVVAGAGPYLWDLDLETFMPHTFAADLDVTIASPAGTVVTLTTDNGAGNDNVFDGTLWDDQANPGGQVPYTSNNGLVTDHVYANLTLASPLVPEEAFGAFRGEDPNGTWTITISDDLPGDGGSLNSWTLHLHTLPAAPFETTGNFTNNTPLAIPTGPAVVSGTVVVAGAGTRVTSIRLTTNLTHTFAADLDVTLASPAGTVATLTTDNGAGNDNVFNGTLWDDAANPAGQVPYTTNNGLASDHAYVNLTLASPLVAEEAMSAFLGEDPNGTWTITISDDVAGDGGELASWTLEVTTGVAPCQLTCAADVVAANDPGQCGAVVNFAAPTVVGDCGVVTCAPPSGSFFPVGGTAILCTSTAGPSCGLNVTVNDTEAPVLTCPADISVATPTPIGVVVDFTTPTATDNCPGVGAVGCVPPSGSTFPVGTTLDTCSVTDAVGNTASCNFNVVVGQETPVVPSLGVLGLATLVLLVLLVVGLRMRRSPT